MTPEYRFKTKPFQHQYAAWQVGKDRPFFAYLMEMGTGKSKVLTDDIAYNFERGKINGALIVAPKSVCGNWIASELPTHLPQRIYDTARVVRWSPANTKTKEAEIATLFKPEPLQLHVLVMNPDALNTERGFETAKQFLRGHDALMAVDESTLMKSPTSKRSKTITKLGNLAALRRILTGSVAPESPLNVFQQFQFLNDGCLGTDNYYAFRNRYAILRKRVINGKSFDEVIGYQNVEELNRRMNEHAFVALKKDCLDLPPKVFQRREVELTPTQKQIYDRIRSDALFELDDGRAITAPMVLTRLMRLRQIVCNFAPFDNEIAPTPIEKTNPRVGALVEMLDDYQGKALIWSNFVASIHEIKRAIVDEYGEGVAGAVHGEVPISRRQELFDAFQKGALRFLVMHPRTAGHGITLTAANLVVYYDNDWSLELRAQSEDRAHRIGQGETVTYVDLVAPGTIDQKILDHLLNKRSLSDRVTGEGWKELFE